MAYVTFEMIWYPEYVTAPSEITHLIRWQLHNPHRTPMLHYTANSFLFFCFFFGWSVSIQSIITPLQFRLTTDLQITRWGCYTNSATESHQHKCWLETDIPPSIWFHLNHWQRVLSLKAEFVYFITVLWSFVICFFYLPNLINPVDSCLCIPPSFVLGTKQTIFL